MPPLLSQKRVNTQRESNVRFLFYKAFIISCGFIMTTNSSIYFGYDKFYSAYYSYPDNKRFIELSSFPLPSPSEFSHKNAHHCCLAALHGHYIHAPSESNAKKNVTNKKLYEKTIAARMKLFESLVDEFNMKHERSGRLSGCITIITIDENKPVLEPADFRLVASLGGSNIIRALEQYHHDRKYKALGQAARLNHFAQEYGHTNFTDYKKFLNQLDIAAQEMGFPSYEALCVPSRYLKHIQQSLIKDQENENLLLDLKEKMELLESQSVFTIERYISSRKTKKQDVFKFHVDVTKEGEVAIEFKTNTQHAKFYISSNYISNSSDDYFKIWSGESTPY